jgi:hypothetical protein
VECNKKFLFEKLVEDIWIKNLNLDGANFAWQKQNKKLFFFQKYRLTSVEDNTNAPFVVVKYGYKVEDHQLKVCIDSIFDQNFKF